MGNANGRKSYPTDGVTESSEQPFDAVDFGLMLLTATVPPHWPWAVALAITTVARRSPRVASYLCKELGIDPGQAPAWLLPGATALVQTAHGEPLDRAATEPLDRAATLGGLASADATAPATDSLAASLARLPKRVDLLKLPLHTSSTAIPLGVGADGVTVWADVASDTYHVGLYGQTGAGKDTLLRCWFVMLARRNAPSAVQFAFLDGKGDWLVPQLATLGHMFSPPAGGYGKQGDANILAAVQRIDAEAQRRQQVIQAAGCISRDAYIARTGATMPLLVVVATDVMTSVAGEVESLLIALVSKARSLGIRVVVSMQSPTKQDTRWRGNLSTVLAGALQAASQDEPALGVPVKDVRYRPSQLPPPSKRPGVFVGRVGGQQVLLQAPWLSDAAFEAQVGMLPTRPHQGAKADDADKHQGAKADDADYLASLLADASLPESGNETEPRYSSFTACTSDVTSLPEPSLPALTGAEIALVTKLLVTGVSPSDAAKKLPGYSPKLYKQFKAKVQAVADLLAGSDAKADAEDMDAPGGPSLPDAFNF